MAAVALAIVDKNNTPLYVREFDDGGDGDNGFADEGVLFGLGPMQQQQSSLNAAASSECWFALHASLDRLDQFTIAAETGKKNHPKDNFTGLLSPLGNGTRVYGYLTNTNTKFLLIIEDDNDAEATTAEVKRLFGYLHEMYTQEVMNPFSRVSSATEQRLSKKFDQRVQQHIASFNQAEI